MTKWKWIRRDKGYFRDISSGLYAHAVRDVRGLWWWLVYSHGEEVAGQAVSLAEAKRRADAELALRLPRKLELL